MPSINAYYIHYEPTHFIVWIWGDDVNVERHCFMSAKPTVTIHEIADRLNKSPRAAGKIYIITPDCTRRYNIFEKAHKEK